MQKPALTVECALTAFRNFFSETPFLFFGTGTSCAVDSRFGMGALKDTLISSLDSLDLTSKQREEWKEVKKALCAGSDLENALNAASDPCLIEAITGITGRCVASVDQEYSSKLIQGSVEWPATHLVARLVETLPETDPILHAVTPNYDLLCEYACECRSIPYTNGFSGGWMRRMDWNAARRAFLIIERESYSRRTMKPVHRCRKHLRLYKVHGSLNYFFCKGSVVENNSWTWAPPEFVQRVMITPGSSKYEILQRYREELLRSADTAIAKATQFLFVGYGFNDRHLEEYIKRKLVSQGCKGVVVTKDCNPRIESLLQQAPNLWLVCQSQHKPEDTQIFNQRYADWLYLPSCRLWNAREFAYWVFGG